MSLLTANYYVNYSWKPLIRQTEKKKELMNRIRLTVDKNVF